MTRDELLRKAVLGKSKQVEYMKGAGTRLTPEPS